jgi:hypothetical protein
MALTATYMLQPGEPFPAEASSSSSASSSTSTSSSTSSTIITSTTAVAATATAAASSHSTLSSGAIAGIVVGAAAVLSLGAALFFYIGRSKTLQSEVQRATTTTQHLPPSHGMYQSPSGQVFVPMKIDDSVRNSTTPYDIAPSQMYGRDVPKPEGGVSAEEAHSLRSTNGSPGTGGGAWAGVPLGPYGQQYAAANPQA